MNKARANKLQRLCADFGFETTLDLLQAYSSDSVAPAICMNLNCDYTTEYEPDQDRGYCEVCGSNTVTSAFVLAGVI